MHMLHVTHFLHILYWIKIWTPAYITPKALFNSSADFEPEFVQLTEVKFNISFSCKKKKSSSLKKDENILKAVEKIVLFFIKNI